MAMEAIKIAWEGFTKWFFGFQKGSGDVNKEVHGFKI